MGAERIIAMSRHKARQDLAFDGPSVFFSHAHLHGALPDSSGR